MAERDPQIGTGDNYPAHDVDYGAWLDAQIEALRDRRFDQLDLANLIDEITDLGNSSYNAFVSALRVVLLHMLKWDLQEDHRSRGWANSIEEHRNRVRDELETSPSYRTRVGSALAKAYRQARSEAASETRMPLRGFPSSNPFTFDEIMTREHHLRDVPPDSPQPEHNDA